MEQRTQSCRGNDLIVRLAATAALLAPGAAFAQASPFDTGANSLVTFALTIATPVAVLIVIALAIAAAVGRISWGWVRRRSWLGFGPCSACRGHRPWNGAMPGSLPIRSSSG